MLYYSFLTFLSLLGSGVSAAVVRKTLTIGNAQIAPDGFERSAAVINGMFPGPVISGNVGDTFRMDVVNELHDESLDLLATIHWHGFFQRSTIEMDGVDMVTQCPITNIPGRNTFTYNIEVPDQPGTYWYHSHYRTQYCDGVRGAFIVYDPHDPHAALYDIDDESTIITLSDWYHFPAPIAPVIVFANSTLINGRGRYRDSVGEDVSGELSVISVEKGKRYRMRLISMSCDPNFTFSIDGHWMTVIEVDGVSTTPLVVDEIQVFAAQRYSFVLNADQPVDNYWIRSFPQSASPNVNGSTFDNGLNSAILRYVGASEKDPKTASTVTQTLSESDLHPLTPAPVPGIHEPGAADIDLRLELNFTGDGFTVNEIALIPPSIPVLLQVLSGNVSAMELLPEGSLYELEKGKVVDVTIQGSLGGPHPMHLHGHNFWVIRSSGNSSYNFVDPVVRDVVTVDGVDDEVTIRFKTDNPGPWLFHCHIDWHLNTGLGVVFAEAPALIAAVEEKGTPFGNWVALCPAYEAFMALHEDIAA